MSGLKSFKILAVLPGRIVRQVELSFLSLNFATAIAIAITGDFCGGKFLRLPMRKTAGSVWRLRLLLGAGQIIRPRTCPFFNSAVADCALPNP